MKAASYLLSRGGVSRLRVSLFVVLFVDAAVSFGQSGETARKPDGAPQAFPPLPAVRPSPIAGFDDEDSHIRSIQREVDELASRARQTEDAPGKAETLLTAANLILARQLEPYWSRAILQIPAADSAGSTPAITEALDRADRLITEASESIRALQVPVEDEPANPVPDNVTRLSRRAEALRAFANGQRAYLPGDDKAESASHRRRAASALSPLLEDSDIRISSAARMWQAALRALEDDPAPALLILESSLTDPAPDSLPYAFFSRLLRCRLIAARGGWAAALAMLTQIEERANDWFTDPQRRADATRACAYVRLQIVRNWYEHLSPAGESDERAWCVGEAERINERYFKSVVTTLRLVPATPLLASPSDAGPTKTGRGAGPD